MKLIVKNMLIYMVKKTIVIYHKCGMNNQWYYQYVALKKEGIFYNIKKYIGI